MQHDSTISQKTKTQQMKSIPVKIQGDIKINPGSETKVYIDQPSSTPVIIELDENQIDDLTSTHPLAYLTIISLLISIVALFISSNLSKEANKISKSAEEASKQANEIMKNANNLIRSQDLRDEKNRKDDKRDKFEDKYNYIIHELEVELERGLIKVENYCNRYWKLQVDVYNAWGRDQLRLEDYVEWLDRVRTIHKNNDSIIKVIDPNKNKILEEYKLLDTLDIAIKSEEIATISSNNFAKFIKCKVLKQLNQEGIKGLLEEKEGQ